MQKSTLDKPFSCSKCYKRFAQARNLKAHEKIYTSDKPSSCLECDKTFAQASNLKTHEKIHTGDKPFSCPKLARHSRRQAIPRSVKKSTLVTNQSATQSVAKDIWTKIYHQNLPKIRNLSSFLETNSFTSILSAFFGFHID